MSLNWPAFKQGKPKSKKKKKKKKKKKDWRKLKKATTPQENKQTSNSSRKQTKPKQTRKEKKGGKKNENKTKLEKTNKTERDLEKTKNNASRTLSASALFQRASKSWLFCCWFSRGVRFVGFLYACLFGFLEVFVGFSNLSWFYLGLVKMVPLHWWEFGNLISSLKTRKMGRNIGVPCSAKTNARANDQWWMGVRPAAAASRRT